MSDPLGLSIGTTNLVAACVGNQPVIRRSVLTLFGHAAPEVGVPSAHTDGIVLSGFVERVGDPVPLVAADGSSHHADQLLVDALQAMVYASGGEPTPDTAIAVPAHWGTSTLWALRNAMRTNPTLAPNGTPVRLISDAVASLTALNVNPGLSPHGVVALLDFGGGGTSITLADAASGFEPIEDTARYTEFSGDQIDQALLNHVLEGITNAGGIDPAATAAVGSLSLLREECRDAKERLSAETVTELIAELPGYRSGIRVTRAELENLIAQPLSGVLAVLENALERNRISWSNVSALVTIGGGASIPLITQQLSEHSQAPVVTTPQPALDAAVGAALFAAFGADADAKTGVAPVLPVDILHPSDVPGSATFRALAWSQDDDTADDIVPYTGDLYDTGGTAARPPVQYVEPTEPIEEPRSTFNRLPQLVFGVAAVIAVVAVGGVAVALTSASDSTKATEPPITATSVGSKSVAPPPSTPPPVQTVTVTNEPPPPPPPTTTVPPPVTHIVTMTPTTTEPTTTKTTTTTTTTTTTSPTTTTTTPTTTETTTTTTTTPSMTTSYITVPFVPVPIPIQVPNQGPQSQAPQYPAQAPQYPYQQAPQYPYQAPQYPYQYQQPQQLP
jgi:actin-like ATPase involved in cell morphogenesis